MADCELKAGCIFFNDRMADMPAMANLMKQTYCTGDANRCARHMVATACGKSAVPADLYPDQSMEAEAIIRQKKGE